MDNAIEQLAGAAAPTNASATDALVATPVQLFHDYLAVFIVAFLVTVLATPVMRRLAVANGVIDRPSESRKLHRVPVAYLGGVAVFLGVLAGIAFSYAETIVPQSLFKYHDSLHDLRPVPISIVLGMTLIMLTGLIDDVVGLVPRLKIGGQLLAAAALAMQDVGTKVAQGVMAPIGRAVGNEGLVYYIPLPAAFESLIGQAAIEVNIVYWVGVAIIAIFVLGACNASNLIDGLDGLLSGVTAIAAAALLVVALMLAATDDGVLDGSRIVIALALLGACLGFLPHNFNPATIFLGDSGSLLLGFLTIVLVLSLGDTGKTQLVIAGLVIYSIPIIDTILAIVRRKLAGRSMSSADDQHLHHMLKRALGVKGAVLTLYAIGIAFGLLGIWLTLGRVRVVFTVAMVFATFIGVTAVKIARRQAIEAHVLSKVELGRPGAVATAEHEATHKPDEPNPAPIATERPRAT
ncbi:MAG: MraY family glycosyltransferase [Phycisphaerales bacterium]